MSLEAFGAYLRKQREQKQLSLTHISQATRISTKFLEAIEKGKFSLLPQAYIRAFVREYARAIDLDPEEIIRQYDQANEAIQQAAEQWVARARRTTVKPERASVPLLKLSPIARRSVSFAAILAGVALLVLYLANYGTVDPADKSVTEIPFDTVVRESEAVAARPDTAPDRRFIAPRRADADSLRLEITTIDSVWIAITIDNVRRGEYLFGPQRSRTWVGRERFVLSVGNAGAATFRLNGQDLGSLGKPGMVARNVVITAAGVEMLE